MSSTIRHAVRRLLRERTLTIAAVLTLALGIGATTAVFTVVNAVLLQPLAYPSPERLVDLSHTLTISGITRVDQSDATFLYYARENRVFSGIGAYRITGVNVAGSAGGSTTVDARAERLSAGLVSASTFSVLGAAPILGRTFRDNEDRRDAAHVVLLGQRLWERKFGADRGIIGRQISIDGVPREVVGIMPADFDLPGARTDVWLPLGIDPAHTASAAFDYRGVGRLRDGVSLEAAAADLQRLLPLVPEAYPGRLTAKSIEQIRMRAVVRPLRNVVVGDVGRVLWVVLGAVGCVLLIACANVMNLLLVRAEGRQHELAVRRALGAERWTLARDHLAEGGVLAVVGAVLGLGVAVAGVRVLRSLEGSIDVPRLAEVRVGALVLAVVAAVTVLATLLVSVLPALRAASSTALPALTEWGARSPRAEGGIALVTYWSSLNSRSRSSCSRVRDSWPEASRVSARCRQESMPHTPSRSGWRCRTPRTRTPAALPASSSGRSSRSPRFPASKPRAPSRSCRSCLTRVRIRRCSSRIIRSRRGPCRTSTSSRSRARATSARWGFRCSKAERSRRSTRDARRASSC